MKKNIFLLYLRGNYSSEEVCVVFTTRLKHVLREINKIKNTNIRYKTADLHRANVEGEYISAGKLVCKFQMLPKYYSRSKGEFYF